MGLKLVDTSQNGSLNPVNTVQVTATCGHSTERVTETCEHNTEWVTEIRGHTTELVTETCEHNTEWVTETGGHTTELVTETCGHTTEWGTTENESLKPVGKIQNGPLTHGNTANRLLFFFTIELFTTERIHYW